MPLTKKLIFSLIPALVVFGGLELVLRATGFEYSPREKQLFRPTVAEFVGTVENYHQTVFDPPGYIWIRQDNIVGRSVDGGFQYKWPVEKKPGVTRVAFLGGSTSETGSDHPFPERCIKLLNRVAGEEKYEELNVACSSYSTHQSLLALKKYVLPRNPDIVVVYHGWNDSAVLSDQMPDYTKEGLLKEKADEARQESHKNTFVGNLAVTKLVGKVVDTARGPQSRVPIDQFEQNMRSIVELCGERNIPVVVVVRPLSKTLPYAAYEDYYAEVYASEYGNTKKDIYEGQWEKYTAVQRMIGQEYDHVRLAHADDYLLHAQDEMAAETTNLTIFVRDACHNTGIGYQKIAESVAMTIAPDLKDEIEAEVDSADYWAYLANDSMQVEAIDEVIYAAEKAKRIDPSVAPKVDPLIKKAESLRGFYELFDYGKWSGEAKPSWPDQIEALSKCLEMRPNDYGVILQMFRVCMYNGQPGAAAEPMSKFKPSTGTQQYQWLKLLFQSHGAAQRWNQAIPIAEAILKINPNDREAAGFLQQVQQARQQGRL